MAEGKVIAEHTRHFPPHDNSAHAKTIYDWRHYLTVLQRKPGALRNGAPFDALPESFQRLQSNLLKRQGDDREVADILALVLFHKQSLVEKAVEEALTLSRPSKQHVLNCLSRLQQGHPPTISLQTEPLADTKHFDHLREKKHVH